MLPQLMKLFIQNNIIYTKLGAGRGRQAWQPAEAHEGGFQSGVRRLPPHVLLLYGGLSYK